MNRGGVSRSVKGPMGREEGGDGPTGDGRAAGWWLCSPQSSKGPGWAMLAAAKADGSGEGSE